MPKMRFRVWEEGHDEEDSEEVIAIDAEEAAESWAESDDIYSAEYRILGGSEVVLCVRDFTGKVTRFKVSGEAVPQYYANELPEANTQNDT